MSEELLNTLYHENVQLKERIKQIEYTHWEDSKIEKYDLRAFEAFKDSLFSWGKEGSLSGLRSKCKNIIEYIDKCEAELDALKKIYQKEADMNEGVKE